MKSLAELGSQDMLMRGGEFCRAARIYARERGDLQNAAALAETSREPERVRQVLKASVGAGSLGGGSPSAWGSELASYRALQQGFFESLRSRSIFFRLLQDGAFARTPMNTRIAAQVSNVTGRIVRPGAPKPVSRLDLAGSVLEPIKAIGQIVLTEELLNAAGPGAEATFNRMLRAAVGHVVDSEFLAIAGLNVAATNATADPLADLKALLDAVNVEGIGSMYWAATPGVANTLATYPAAATGNLLFPTMSPTGGTLLGLPAHVSSAVPEAAGSPATDTMWLLDGSGIAADAAEVEIRMSRQGTIEMSDAPAGDGVWAVPLGTTATVSLWQQNLVAIEAEVRFAVHRFRPSAVAMLTGISW
jgi:hypothetical protein